SSPPPSTLQAWATKLVKEHDKNGNMILEPDEQGFLGSTAASEDLNHDGKITIDEIVMHHSGVTAAATAPSSTSSASTSSTSSSSRESGRSSEREHDRERYRDGGFGGYSRHDRDSGSSSESRS